MHKLLVIDNANIMFKSIFAWRNYSQVPVTYLYLRQIISYLKKIEVTLEDKVIVGIDYGSWRKSIDSNYKAQRKDLRESVEDATFWEEMFKEFNNFTVKLDQCLPFNFIKIYNCEFDDIASVAIRYLDSYDEKVIISTDEDLHQLCVFPNVRIFSPYTKKYKIIKNPEKILLKKLRGDKSDNLLTIPKTDLEWEKRKMIVDLIHLPTHIDDIIKPTIQSLPIKNLYLNKIPYRSCREAIKTLYKL